MTYDPLTHQRAQADFAMTLERLLPEGHKGLVIAELHENQSELQTDYHAHRTTRQVVIGFTKSARSLFPNMRKAAATFGPTAHLAEKDSRFEHRENYSMGAGTYLKDGYSHSDGWSVSILDVKYAGGLTGAFSKVVGGEAE